MTDFELRIKAINLATDELRAQPAQYMSATQVGSYTRPAFNVQKRAEEIYDWLKAAEPSKSSVGGYTLFFDNGELRIAKEGVDLSVGVDLNDLWDDLHQDAAEPGDQPASQSCEPEATTPAYETLKKSVLSAFREYHGPKDDSFLVYHTPVFETLISTMVGVSWLDSPDRPMPGDCSSFRPAAAESPAEPAKRVPQIGDTVVFVDSDAIVFHVDTEAKEFSVVKTGNPSVVSSRLPFEWQGQPIGWTFKESSTGAPAKRVPVPGDELEYHGGYPGEGGYLWFPITVKAVGEDGQIFFNFTHGNQREFLTHASLEGVSWRWK